MKNRDHGARRISSKREISLSARLGTSVPQACDVYWGCSTFALVLYQVTRCWNLQWTTMCFDICLQCGHIPTNYPEIARFTPSHICGKQVYGQNDRKSEGWRPGGATDNPGKVGNSQRGGPRGHT